ncbi:MAG: DUF4375 domain-containing protein [Bacilli bacterium]|nr:DUF4375 domain-containing protein [Bacilli bacterium]
MDSDYDLEFTNEDIMLVNEFIADNDSLSMTDYLKDKKKIIKDVVKKDVLKDIDSLWSFIMDQSYDIWKNNSMSRDEFLSKLSDYEKLAVKFGNFNYQVENGGLMQWDCNGYSEDLEDLQEFLTKSDYSKKDRFLGILDAFSNVKDAINKLDKYDDWYAEDMNTRWNSLETFDKDYYSFKDNWIEYFEDYLFQNMPDEYLEKIKEYNLSKINI